MMILLSGKAQIIHDELRQSLSPLSAAYMSFQPFNEIALKTG